ncbi:hypothetical protein [Streptomyces sporangiiformans]|nr:hypothetical protein [Streptomyces sporangiiformans]
MQQPGPGSQPPQGFGPPPPSYAPQNPYAQQTPQHAPQNPYAQQAAPYPPAPTPPQPPAQGPDFVAADRHNAVVVDAEGVSFENHGMNAEFPWPVIRSVHYKPGATGRGLMVAVVHVDGSVYECGVDAKRRERLQEWFGQLASVLGYYRPAG